MVLAYGVFPLTSVLVCLFAWLTEGSRFYRCRVVEGLEEETCASRVPELFGFRRGRGEDAALQSCKVTGGEEIYLWPQPQKLDVETVKVDSVGRQVLGFETVNLSWENVVDFQIKSTFDRFCQRTKKMFMLGSEKRSNGDRCGRFIHEGSEELTISLRREEQQVCEIYGKEYYKLDYDRASVNVERAGVNVNLNMKEPARVVVSTCAASGVQYAFETLMQVVVQLDTFTKRLRIVDWPHFEWRGLMLDTSRHFVTVDDILTTLSAMAFNKLNVLHLHLTDAASFPLYLDKLPQLFNGWSASQKYTKADLKRIVHAASKLSIEVIPEIDMPQHTKSWNGVPTIVLDCPTVKPRDPNDYDDPFKTMDFAVLNISSPITLEVVRTLLHELAKIFPSQRIHIGFDEVDYRCWDAYPSFRKWRRNNRLSNRAALRQFFLNVSKEVVAMNKTWIVWQDALEMLDYLPEGGIVQAWKCWKESWTGDELLGRYIGRLASQNTHAVVASTCLYLDYESQWTDLYKRTPPSYAIGGEACLWTEKIDFTNLHCRLWPRTSAVAERLWNTGVTQSFAKVNKRLVTFSRILEETEGIKVTQHDVFGFSKTEDACPLLRSQSIQRDPFEKESR